MPKRCPKCGGIMVPKRTPKGIVYVCRKCGYTEMPKEKALVLAKNMHGDTTMLTLTEEDKRKNASFTTLVSCPRCGHTPVQYIEMQTRSADEPPTRFYRCPKCGYKWREY